MCLPCPEVSIFKVVQSFNVVPLTSVFNDLFYQLVVRCRFLVCERLTNVSLLML